MLNVEIICVINASATHDSSADEVQYIICFSTQSHQCTSSRVQVLRRGKGDGEHRVGRTDHIKLGVYKKILVSQEHGVYESYIYIPADVALPGVLAIGRSTPVIVLESPRGAALIWMHLTDFRAFSGANARCRPCREWA